LTLQQTEADPTTLFNRPAALLRYFPRLEKDKLDKPAVNELTLSITDNLQIADLWTGAAEISFPDVPNEELSALKPVKVGAGFRYSLAYSVTDLRILKDFTV
jgi:Acetoacetate decarboxylase (ADC)